MMIIYPNPTRIHPNPTRTKTCSHNTLSNTSLTYPINTLPSIHTTRQTFHAYQDILSAKVVQLSRRQTALAAAVNNNDNPHNNSNAMVSNSAAAVMSDIERLVSDRREREG